MSDPNKARITQRRIGVAVVGAVVLVAIGLFVFGGNDSRAPDAPQRIEGATTQMTELARQPQAETNAFQVYNDRLTRLEQRAENSEGEVERLRVELQAREDDISRLNDEREVILQEAEAIVASMAEELESSRVNSGMPGTGYVSSANPGRPTGSVPVGQQTLPGQDPFAPVGVVGASNTNSTRPADMLQPPSRVLQSIDFSSAEESGAPTTSPVIVRDTANYVPPNAYASARVLVGVDATTGTEFGADPKPILLRITGPARSAMTEGRALETDIIGCLVNGAAYAELSSEKVYVRLERMTCPMNDGSGRTSETEVEGYVAFAGKAGVRGRVISREGDLTERALIAGTLSGLGNSLSQARPGGGFLGGGGITLAGGDVDTPTAGELATTSIAGGVGQAANTLAEYYIERAEQYQPVIEMPTGIDVEIVFLSGATIR
jgi:conjugal transfer pilus assembly protein TraB